LAIGVLAAAIAIALHAAGLLRGIEAPLFSALSRHRIGGRSLGAFWEYSATGIVALVVSWLTVSSARRGRIALITAILVVELAAISYIRHRYMDTPWFSATLQVVLGGALVFLAGLLIGSA